MTEEGKFFENKRNVAMVAIAGVALAAVLSAVAFGNKTGATDERPQPTNNEAPAGANTNQAPALETPTGTVTEKGIDSYAQAMEKYDSMGIDEFEKLPRDERLAYSQYLIDKTVDTGAYDVVYGNKESEAYSILPPTVSKNNSGQEILDNNVYNLQLAFAQYIAGEADPSPYDLQNGQKALSSVFYSVGSDRPITDIYQKDKDLENTLNVPVGLELSRKAENTSSLKTGKVFENNDKVKYKIVSYFDSAESQTSYARFVYCEFTSYDGSQKAVWLMDAQTTNSIQDLNSNGHIR